MVQDFFNLLEVSVVGVWTLRDPGKTVPQHAGEYRWEYIFIDWVSWMQSKNLLPSNTLIYHNITIYNPKNPGMS